MHYEEISVQNRFFDQIVLDKKPLSPEFAARAEHCIQTYKEKNPLHYHNCLELGMCIKGSGVEFISDEVYPFCTDSVSVIHRGCIHDAHIVMNDPSDAPSEWIFIFADLDALGIRCGCQRSVLLNDPELTDLFWIMFRELDTKPEGYRDVFPLILRAFLLKFCRLVPEDGGASSLAPRDERIALAINYIAQFYNKNISVEDLASRCGMSVSNFRKKFRAAVGVSPLDYLNGLRISVAHHLLCANEMPILTVSEDVGFRSLSSFNRLFKRTFGMSPRQVRRANKGG